MSKESTAKEDECSCCYDDRREAGLPPRKLVKLSGTTAGYNARKQQLHVYVCEVCDSPPPPPPQDTEGGMVFD